MVEEVLTNTPENDITHQPGQAEAQKMLTQEQVNALIGREKKEAAEKARREAEATYAAELARFKANTPQQSMGGMAQPTADEIYQQVKQRLLQEAEQQAHESEMKKVANDYFSKMSNGNQLFEDFNEVLGEFRPESFPQVVYLASQMDNTPQVMYELAKNPAKLAAIHSLAQADPNQAKRALKQLSDSIAHNEQAKDEYTPVNAPLSKPKPSMVGTDKGEASLKDLKKASWLKT